MITGTTRTRVLIILTFAPLGTMGCAVPSKNMAACNAGISPIETHVVSAGGVRIWCKVAGNGPACITPSPTWGPSSDLLRRTLTPLEKRFTMIYVDTRCTGRSGRTGPSSQNTWDVLVEDLEAVRKHFRQDRIWLLGHSMAGVYAMQYAIRNPNRVAGLILVGTVPSADFEKGWEQRLERFRGAPWYNEAVEAVRHEPTSDSDFAASARAMLPLYFHDASKIERHQADFAAGTLSMEAMRSEFESKRHLYDLCPRLGEIAAPTLIVAGDDDIFCPLNGALRLHRDIPRSKLLCIAECGHFPWLEQPEVFFREIPGYLDALGSR